MANPENPTNFPHFQQLFVSHLFAASEACRLMLPSGRPRPAEYNKVHSPHSHFGRRYLKMEEGFLNLKFSTVSLWLWAHPRSTWTFRLFFGGGEFSLTYSSIYIYTAYIGEDSSIWMVPAIVWWLTHTGRWIDESQCFGCIQGGWLMLGPGWQVNRVTHKNLNITLGSKLGCCIYWRLFGYG